jgi:hypothetical protein
MSQSAKVLSVQALKDFRIAMINFIEEARNALSGTDMELKRNRDWLERDQLGYWQMQVKRRHEAMMMARTDLHRRRISQQGSDAVSDTEQKEALREAQRKLQVAEEKVAIVKKLIPVFQHAAAEYASAATPMLDHLSGGMEKSLMSLQRMVDAIEAYLATAPPNTSAYWKDSTSSAASEPMTRPAGESSRTADATEASTSTDEAEAEATNEAASSQAATAEQETGS